MTIICSIILFITWSFSFLNAINISKVPEYYVNRKMQYSTARTAVLSLYKKFYLCLLITCTQENIHGLDFQPNGP